MYPRLMGGRWGAGLRVLLAVTIVALAALPAVAGESFEDPFQHGYSPSAILPCIPPPIDDANARIRPQDLVLGQTTDPAGQSMYVTETYSSNLPDGKTATGRVAAVDSPGVSARGALLQEIPTAAATNVQPHRIALIKDGAIGDYWLVWSESAAGKAGKMDISVAPASRVAGESPQFQDPANGRVVAIDAVVDSNNPQHGSEIWVGDFEDPGSPTTDKIMEWKLNDASFSTFDLASNDKDPTDFGVDAEPSPIVWWTNFTENSIQGRGVDLTTTRGPFPLNFSGPHAITPTTNPSQDPKMYFAIQCDHRISWFNPANCTTSCSGGAKSVLQCRGSDALPLDLVAVAASNSTNIYYSDQRRCVGEVVLQGGNATLYNWQTKSTPKGMAVGVNGDIWFTEEGLKDPSSGLGVGGVGYLPSGTGPPVECVLVYSSPVGSCVAPA